MMTRGEVALVVPDCPWRLKRGSQAASTTARTTGKYSGRHPAITALTASFSTVARPKLGGTSATSVPRETRGGLDHAFHALAGGRDHGQAVGDAALEPDLHLVGHGGA